MAAVTVERSDVIAYRFHRHQLDREAGSAPATDVDLLAIGVQDTGTEGSAWVLEARGARPADLDDLILAWTIRGAPHAYRRRDVATAADARFDVIRGYLRFFAPAPVKAIATYLDAPLAAVTANLPADALEVRVDGLETNVKRYALADDLDALAGAAGRAPTGVVRIVGSHDSYLQLRDREVLVPDTARLKDLWRSLGRPGAVLVDGEVVATWRPRASGRILGIELDAWTSIKGSTRTALLQEAERLAAHRGLTLGAVTNTGA